MVDAARASRLLSGVRAADFEEEMRGMSHSILMDMILVSIVQMANGALGLREALAQSSSTLARALARADKYRKKSMAHTDSLAQLRQETAAREEGYIGHLQEMESRAAASEAKMELALERSKATVAQIEELTRRLQSAMEEAWAAEEKAAAAEKATAEAVLEKADAVACTDEASARTVEAEAKSWEAENKVQRAEAEAGQAVSKFKASPEFRQEVLEASLDAYLQGFEMGKVRVAAALEVDIADLEDIRAGGPDEEPAGEKDEGKPGPGEP